MKAPFVNPKPPHVPLVETANPGAGGESCAQAWLFSPRYEARKPSGASKPNNREKGSRKRFVGFSKVRNAGTVFY